MFTHVVLMDIRHASDIAPVVDRLRAMQGQIPSLRSIEVGVHDGIDPRGASLCLITRHDDREGLRAYAAHPVHQEVLAYLKTVIAASRVVDWTASSP